MPQVSAEVWVPIEPAVAFAVSQTTGELRRSWDTFIRLQYFLDGAAAPEKGVQTFTRARLGPSMISKYVSYRPPTSVGMVMTKGPWFFSKFAGGWRFAAEVHDGVSGTRAVWKYTYAIRPGWLRKPGEAIGQRILGREVQARIQAFAAACRNEDIVRRIA